MLTIINFRPFVTVQKLIPGREYPNPADTFPVRRLKSSDLFLALCIRYLPHPTGHCTGASTFSPILVEKIVKVLRFYQRTSICQLVMHEICSTHAGRCQCPHSGFLVFAPPWDPPHPNSAPFARQIFP